MSAENNQFPLPAQMLPVSPMRAARPRRSRRSGTPSAPAPCRHVAVSGFKSDMRGTKATASPNGALAWIRLPGLRLFRPRRIRRAFRERHHRRLARADPRGAGMGRAGAGNRRWLEHGRLDRVACLCACSSARHRSAQQRIAGLVLDRAGLEHDRADLERIADEARKQIEREGQFMRASEYDPAGYPITRRLIDEGKAHLIPPDAPIDPARRCASFRACR